MSGGLLTAVDLQQQMLDELVRRAAQAGVAGIEAIAGDAQHLPLPSDSFDAAYLISVLGEVPDRNAALDEIARVLKRGGRLVIGEFAFDPDFVPLGEFRAAAAAAGFEMERVRGWRLSYLARLRLH